MNNSINTSRNDIRQRRHLGDTHIGGLRNRINILLLHVNNDDDNNSNDNNNHNTSPTFPYIQLGVATVPCMRVKKNNICSAYFGKKKKGPEHNKNKSQIHLVKDSNEDEISNEMFSTTTTT